MRHHCHDSRDEEGLFKDNSFQNQNQKTSGSVLGIFWPQACRRFRWCCQDFSQRQKWWPAWESKRDAIRKGPRTFQDVNEGKFFGKGIYTKDKLCCCWRCAFRLIFELLKPHNQKSEVDSRYLLLIRSSRYSLSVHGWKNWKDHSTGEQDGGLLQVPIKPNLSTPSAPMPSTPRPCQRSTTTNPPWCCGGSPETTRQRANWMAQRHPSEAKHIYI